MLNDRILITGGTGTLGSELVRQLYGFAKNITILSRDELKQQELKNLYPGINCILGDLRTISPDRFVELTDVMIHTAAMKYIDSSEKNIDECLGINVEGTKRIIALAREKLTSKAIFISSDKAVEATSVYGASKLIGERVWLQANGVNNLKFSIVRSGNIFASKGSIIPKWIKQAAEGQTLFVNREMKRLWISVQGLASFVIAAIDIMRGGEVFIPDCRERTMLSIAEEINAKYGNLSKIELMSGKPYEKISEKLRFDFERTAI